jgi:hypothetical protein
MGEKRAALLCGAGVGGFLVLAGLFAVVAGTVDATGLIEGLGGSVSARTVEVADDSAALALWGGVIALAVGIVLFTACVSVARRRRASRLSAGA